MGHCTKCGVALAEDAKFCGSCGTPVTGGTAAGAPKVQSEKPKATAAQGCATLAVIGIVIYGLATCDSDKTKQDLAARPIKDVTIPELVAAYEDNEARAQQTYGGSRLRLSGTVQSIDLDITDDPVIMLAGVNEFTPVHADLADDAKGIATSLSKGDIVTLTCDDISEVIGNPMLKDCRP